MSYRINLSNEYSEFDERATISKCPKKKSVDVIRSGSKNNCNACTFSNKYGLPFNFEKIFH